MGNQNRSSGWQAQPRSLPRTLSEFRQQEGRDNRKRRLQALWRHIVERGYHFDSDPNTSRTRKATDETNKAEELRAAYEHELLGRVCRHDSSSSLANREIGWKEFKDYAEAKEVGMSTLHCSLCKRSYSKQNSGPSFTTNSTWMEMAISMPTNSSRHLQKQVSALWLSFLTLPV